METKENEKSAEGVVSSLLKISGEIDKLEHAREVHLKATHGRFNLFTTLLGAHDEVRLHTRYLTHLLDPKGSHDCGRLFLDAFLEVVSLTENLNGQDCLFVRKEHGTGGLGNIDIYLEFKNAILVIENKIYAEDQQEQLQRYAEYAKSKKKDAVYIFYLTLRGHSPSENSRGTLDENEVSLISYEKEVLGWLEKCLQETYSFININQALQQYKMVIKQLLGNTLEGEGMEEIKKEIEKNTELVRNSKQIRKALQGVEDDCVRLFFKDLESALSEKSTGLSLKQWGSAKNFAHTGRGNVGWCINGEVIVVEYRPKEKNLFVGAFLHYKTKNPEMSSVIQEIVAVEGDNEKGGIQLGADALGNVHAWGLVQWLLFGEKEYFDNECFENDDFVADMLEKNKRKEKVDECVRKICNFVTAVEAETK